ncbi:glutamate--cysteine ligase [Kocuria aegyptia]|uniref:Putative glutamate--cysteine ligase 2 n=1 Tax=Kocuria aegyptia TaxID=330943 RepID=A0ABN2KKP6_9MICC
MRTFGVEEELLLVDAVTLRPLAAGEAVVDHHDQRLEHGSHGPGAVFPTAEPADVAASHGLTVEFQQEQIEVVSPPQLTLAEQITAIRTGRALADEAARTVGGRAVALATSVSADLPHLVPQARYRRIQQHVGLLAAEQLTCGFHVHVGIASREEGVAVLDRIRVWLPVLLALSANSPFWYGVDTGFASYRYQAWMRWPTAGPSEIFGTVEGYDRHVQDLLVSGVPLDDGMVYFDARLSARFPTVEVRVADVCLDPVHAGVIAALVRALVETAARAWRAGEDPAPVGVAQLRAWSWRAARSGVEGQLVSPTTGAPAAAGEVVAELLELLRPVLAEAGEDEQVQAVVVAILREGTGAHRQREAYASRHDLHDVVADALHIGAPTTAEPHSEPT